MRPCTVLTAAELMIENTRKNKKKLANIFFLMAPILIVKDIFCLAITKPKIPVKIYNAVGMEKNILASSTLMRKYATTIAAINVLSKIPQKIVNVLLLSVT